MFDDGWMIPPGSTIGILGGGQLGRMTALAARRLGYKIHVFEPQAQSVAGMIADKEFNAPYQDKTALKAFAQTVDVVTLEFENIPPQALDWIAETIEVHPSSNVLSICQNRKREKTFLSEKGFPCAKFVCVDSANSLEKGVTEVGPACVLKTADFGYDGKGQVKICEGEDVAKVWETFDAPAGVLEEWVPFQAECSVICARTKKGKMVTFPMAENRHTRHILDLSIVPSSLPPQIEAEANSIAQELAESLEVIGLLAVEFFLTQNGTLLVNELAPRPHNSGHYTFDACITSQFEQLTRAVCGLPLGSTQLLSPVVMVNLLGESWQDAPPDWQVLLSENKARLDLYDKQPPLPGRKMGHYCAFGATTKEALKRAEALKCRLTQKVVGCV